ncbi:aminotransferase class V-fold PLP-dependent enzyme [Micromonospora chalcea]|uniref:aminotransferase class V-fold PLP-dependent enzyme n=1 Tax=Micromonospora chalcea TaxID=1874 RepID=UPI0037FA1C5B
MLTAMESPAVTWQAWEHQVTQLRHRVAALLGAQEHQIGLLADASTAAHQVGSARGWTTRSRIVTCSAEFPGVAHAWLTQRRRGAEVVFVGDRDGRVCLTDYLRAIDGRTALVSVPAVTYSSGQRLPVRDIVEAAHHAGAEVFVDAYQAFAVEPLDVRQWNCDYLVAGFGKYALGLPGVVALYEAAARGGRVPGLTGWQGRRDPHRFDPHLVDWPDDARRFQVGTPAVPVVYAANAALSLIADLDLGQVRRHVAQMARLARELVTRQGLFVTTPEEHGAHLAVLHPAPEAVTRWLADRHVAVAPRGRVVRLAMHAFTTAEDVETACRLLGEFPDARAAERRRSHRQGVVA